MANQKVYIVGPLDFLLKEMWDNAVGYEITADAAKADILCFQGGADISPKMYGEEALADTYCDVSRDSEDLHFFETYDKVKKVGICRGGQFLNVMSDGQMWQDVNNHDRPHEITNLLDIPGSVSFKHGTILTVTSDHHQMMIPHPDYAEILAFADMATEFKSWDKEREMPALDAEVIWYEHTQCLCFQPHPEYNSNFQTKQYFLQLTKYLMG